jgi:hypothetical protein
MESLLTIVPLHCCAISSARADLPLAVGPVTIRACGGSDIGVGRCLCGDVFGAERPAVWFGGRSGGAGF